MQWKNLSTQLRDAEVYLGREDLDRNGMGSGMEIYDRDNDGNDDLLAIGSFLDDGTLYQGRRLIFGQVFTFQRSSGSSTFPSSVVQTGFDYTYNDVLVINCLEGV